MSRAMIAAGLDLGGTKIESQAFGPDWTLLRRRRRDTPRDYGALVAALSEEVAWATGGDGAVPVGVAQAGLVDPRTGLAFTANLCAMGRPLPADVRRATGRPVAFVNDCRALTLSEALLGAARGMSPVAGLILGTGVGGGLAVGGRLVEGPSATGGEFGHVSLPADLVAAHGLPFLRCGCGRMGCTETLISGPGLLRVGLALGAGAGSPEALVAARATDPGAARAWAVWCALVGDLLHTLTCAFDPEAIVVGGGLSRVPGLLDDLAAAQARAQIPGFLTPRLLLAEGGDASGARGAALFAREHHA